MFDRNACGVMFLPAANNYPANPSLQVEFCAASPQKQKRFTGSMQPSGIAGTIIMLVAESKTRTNVAD
jgi:hypothetical protein